MMHDFAKNGKKKRRIVLNDTAFYGLEGSRTLDLSDAKRTLCQQYRFCAHIMHCEKGKINVYSFI